jgi:hypothetical protein
MRNSARFMIVLAAAAGVQLSPAFAEEVPLSPAGIKARSLKVEAAEYAGRKAIRLTQLPGAPEGEADGLAILEGGSFQNGTIEVDLAGQPAAGAAAAARGFVGMAFRVAPDSSKFELIYLRPTNGRAEDQLRRNHSTQYVSFPGFPWRKTRAENPGLYESYVDLEPGVWTRYKLLLDGVKARLFVHGAEQPCLLVNDLKLGPSSGALALWIGPGTEGCFSNLRVTAAPK